MNPFLFLRGELRRSWGGALALALVLAFAGSLSPAVSMMERSIRSGMARAADSFDLLVGARGSSVDLVLGAVYLRPEVLSLLPPGTLEEVKAQGGVRWAAPLAFGDRWRTFPMVGTSSELITQGGRVHLAEGRLFVSHREAVVGAGVPLEIGETFSPSHGSVATASVSGEHGHDQVFHVVGKMLPSGTPWDRAMVVPIEALWEMHGLSEAEGRYSAVVVKPVSIADAYRLRGTFNNPGSQAVFSGEVLTRLFGILEQARQIMLLLASGAQGIALAAALVSGFFAVALKVRTMALLRALGASHGFIALSVWGMVSGIMLAGSLGGLILGRLMAGAVCFWIQKETGIAFSASLTLSEGMTAFAAIACGSAAAFFPAWFACHRTAGELIRSS